MLQLLHHEEEFEEKERECVCDDIERQHLFVLNIWSGMGPVLRKHSKYAVLTKDTWLGF